MTPKKKEFSGVVRALANVANFGLTMGAAILIGYYIGSYLDRKLGTSPWLMLLFLILFMVGAFIKFIQSTKDVSTQANKEGDRG